MTGGCGSGGEGRTGGAQSCGSAAGSSTSSPETSSGRMQRPAAPMPQYSGRMHSALHEGTQVYRLVHPCAKALRRASPGPLDALVARQEAREPAAAGLGETHCGQEAPCLAPMSKKRRASGRNKPAHARGHVRGAAACWAWGMGAGGRPRGPLRPSRLVQHRDNIVPRPGGPGAPAEACDGFAGCR